MKRRAFTVSMAAAPVAAAARFRFRELTPASLELSENGEPVLVYNHGMMLKKGVKEQYRRSCYLHPVYAPGGTVLTDDFPKDHPHHRGICWSWPVVRFDNRTYDVWAVQGMHQRFVRWLSRKAGRDRAVLAVENGWFAGERKAVKETVALTVLPAARGRRTLEFRLSFEATGLPVEICGREVKGYGGFGVRFAPRSGTVLRTGAGVEAKDSDMAKHRWAELEAVFEGRRAGARIEDDPRNPGSPAGWCLRHYGYVAVNYPGLTPVILRPGQPLALAYQVTVFSAT